MSSGEPSPATVKRLFALSRNQCAFPGCGAPIVESTGVVTGVICHIKARSRGGPRYDAEQSDQERHAFGNLILLCSRHSKIIDSQPAVYPVDRLVEMKARKERDGNIELSAEEAHSALRLLDEYRVIYVAPGSSVTVGQAEAIHAQTVELRGRARSPKLVPPAEAIASNLAQRNYLKHLIDRYHQFASKQPDRTDFRYPAIYAHIKRVFGAKWDMIPSARFCEVAEHMQRRIDNTRLGRLNHSRGTPNYSDYQGYLGKYGSHVDGE
jgi:hypothetical protein